MIDVRMPERRMHQRLGMKRATQLEQRAQLAKRREVSASRMFSHDGKAVVAAAKRTPERSVGLQHVGFGRRRKRAKVTVGTEPNEHVVIGRACPLVEKLPAAL